MKFLKGGIYLIGDKVCLTNKLIKSLLGVV